jgi:hypothetical protein
MSQDNQEATPLIEGQEYVATLRLTSVGGEGSLKVELIKTPESFMEGDPNELIEIPMSFLIIDEIVKGLIETNDVAPTKPKLSLVH